MSGLEILIIHILSISISGVTGAWILYFFNLCYDVKITKKIKNKKG